MLLTLLATLVFVTSCDFKLNFTPQKPSVDDDPPEEFTLFSPDTKVSLVLGSKRATDDDRQGYETLKKAITSDGSFSYYQGYTSDNSNSVPVSFGGAEGDVNASAVAMNYIIDSLYDCLGVNTVPLFSHKDYRTFIEIINGKIADGKIKN